jgi:hypothetical protein
MTATTIKARPRLSEFPGFFVRVRRLIVTRLAMLKRKRHSMKGIAAAHLKETLHYG